MDDTLPDSLIDETRAFNRFYTQVIGVLDEHLTDSAFHLAEARVLYEIGTRGHTTGSALAKALEIDRAYLSRILQNFVFKGLISTSPIPGDRRQNSIALSQEGDKAFFDLREKAELAVARILAPLPPSDRRRLAEAMWTIRTLLGDELPLRPVVLRPERVGELGWLIHRQAVLYNEQHGWNAEFEGLIARIYSEFQAAPNDPPRALWVADRGGEVLGSVFVTPHATRPSTAQLRMLYVEPAARGAGIGTMLVAQSIDFARRNGYARLRLWTQSVLISARRIYAAAGFKLVESGPHHSFGKDLVGEYWELEF